MPAARTHRMAALVLAAMVPAGAALAQQSAATASAAGTADNTLRQCTAMSSDNQARLACFDAWAASNNNPT